MKNIFVSSAKELKKLKVLTLCAMLLATSIVLGYFTIPIGNVAKVGFSNIPAVIVAYLFGPITASFFGAASDVVKFMLKPDGQFVIWFTLNAMLAGVIRGVILYKKDVNIFRILICELFVIVLCNWIINTYLIHMMYGKSIIALLPVRITKDLVTYPIRVIVIYLLMKILQKNKRFLA